MGASAGSRRTLEVGGREVSVSNPGKVIFPGSDGRADITKSDLVDYYLAVADGAVVELDVKHLGLRVRRAASKAEQRE